MLPASQLVPNGLSLLRLALGLAFPWLPAEWRLGVIAVAAVTDLLDGLTARWLHGESEVGLVLDPLADKVFVLALAATLIAEGALTPGWALAVAARDGVVLLGAGAAFARGRWADYRRMRPTWVGKGATAAQFALLLALVTGWEGGWWLLWAAATLSVAAAVQYAVVYLRRRPGR